ncbi:MAG: hypothetical protein AAGH53_06565 [Pseudomonadota bacterium]
MNEPPQLSETHTDPNLKNRWSIGEVRFWDRILSALIFMVVLLPLTHTARSEESRKVTKATSKAHIRHGITASQATAAALQANAKAQRSERQISRRVCPDGEDHTDKSSKAAQKANEASKAAACMLVVIDNY